MNGAAGDLLPARSPVGPSYGLVPLEQSLRPGGGAKLTVRNLEKTYVSGVSRTTALTGVDLTVRRGDFTCVIGPSGCGKTSLLNIVAGFEGKTSGEVLFDGSEIGGPGAERGVVFQQGSLFTWMTVRDNVAFGPLALGKRKAEANATADKFLALVGLSSFLEHYPYQLSGGMQQRVGIARALANQPDLLMMDEPFAALDQQTRELLQEEVKRIWRETKQTVFLITHSIEEALFLANHIVVMTARPGRIKAQYHANFSESADPAISTTLEFLEAKRTLFSSLREEAVAAQAVELHR